jgi:hypothetical protein
MARGGHALRRGTRSIELDAFDQQRKGLVIGMGVEQYSRQHVVDVLNRLGYAQVAEEASRVLPDPVDADWLAEWSMQRGLTHDDLISHMGGSP